MAVCRLDDDSVAFPPAEEAEAEDNGLLAVGGDYRFERLLVAYSCGRFGESMFARVSDASKCAFARFAKRMFDNGVPWTDCQVYTEHLARFGAKEIPRSEYLRMLEAAMD